MALGQYKTPGGYAFGETMSALQKCIRRADEEGAMFWAIEMEPQFGSHLWNRLEIISHEDIGLADPLVLPFVHTCREQYWDMRNRGNSGFRLVLANAVLAMCRAKKSRLADHFLITMYRRPARREIPDVALDKHTTRGRQMGRGFDHFFTDGILLQDGPGFTQAVPATINGLPDEYQEEARKLVTDEVPCKYESLVRPVAAQGKSKRPAFEPEPDPNGGQAGLEI